MNYQTTKRQKNRIKLWIKALNNYKKQTRNTLKDKDGRCCLGVACEVFKKHTGHGKWVKNIWGDTCFKVGKDSKSSTLPESVRKWFGFKEGDPRLIVKYENGLVNETKTSASILNDCLKKSFKEIADCVKDTFLDEETNE